MWQATTFVDRINLARFLPQRKVRTANRRYNSENQRLRLREQRTTIFDRNRRSKQAIVTHKCNAIPQKILRFYTCVEILAFRDLHRWSRSTNVIFPQLDLLSEETFLRMLCIAYDTAAAHANRSRPVKLEPVKRFLSYRGANNRTLRLNMMKQCS